MTTDEIDSKDRDVSRPVATVRDRRVIPHGGLPRQIQTWLMVGIAVVILLIILISGHPQPPTVPPAEHQPSATLARPERIRGFERQLSDDEARLRETAERAASGQNEPTAPQRAGVPGSATAVAAPRAEEPSLASDNVAFSKRAGAWPSTQPTRSPDESANATSGSAPEVAALEQWLKAMSAAMPPHASPVLASPSSPPKKESALETAPPARAGQPSAVIRSDRCRLLEGTLIEAVLLNRLDGTYSGPVTAMVTTPVYSDDRQYVVIPAGARILGTAAPVQAWGDTRLAIRFHRLTMPNGSVHSLDQFTGLNQIGETGLRDEVNRHYWQVFGASLAVGALSGLAQLGTRTGMDTSFADASRQSAGASLATSSARILDRYLNVLPTVTIREGYRLKVYLTSDLELPVSSASIGGVR